MHFLSHYYCELPNNKPYFVAGLIIPDLSGNFSRTYNSVIKNCVIANKDSELQLIHQGIISHYKADKSFHNSKLFMQHLSQAIQSFLNEGLGRKRLRLSVIAHVAVELMIDRQIVLEKESICHDFYQAIDNANEKVLSVYFDDLSLVKEKKEFLTRFQFFKQRRFLFLFKDLEHIVFGLNRIYSSVTGIEFSEEEKSRFVNALNNIDAVLRYSWQEILKV